VAKCTEESGGKYFVFCCYKPTRICYMNEQKCESTCIGK
uniref:Antimicrobial peptide 1 n=1 Tax=Taraxacum officinale TaxID=50225 RepID=AMP1_TAROF|nr:RecName: Full=Antimicrobial peptide 1; Short=ToAMP1 [Taraxacum officinale]